MKHRRHHVKKKVHRLKPKKSIFKRPIFWFIFLFLILLLFFYILIFYSKFQVDSVIISGNNNVQKEVLQGVVWDNINKNLSKSIFLTGSKIISKDILNRFPEIESVEVSKKFPKIITIQVKERTPFAVFCQTDDKKCFYIDRNGVIFEILEQIPENTSIIRQLIYDKEVFVGERVVEKNIIDMISNIKISLKDNFQIDVKSAMITTPFRLNIETSENWQIYFNLDSETDLQIAKMNLLLKDEIPIEIRKTLQYVDLRFKARAYYK